MNNNITIQAVSNNIQEVKSGDYVYFRDFDLCKVLMVLPNTQLVLESVIDGGYWLSDAEDLYYILNIGV